MANADKNRVIVLAVVDGGLSVSQAARRFGVTRQWIHRLLKRYRAQGLAGLDPGSRAPHTSPTSTAQTVKTMVLDMRDDLVAQGWDAGAESIRDRLLANGEQPPSRATIHRIVSAADRVTPEPHKRPRSSWIRFEAALPNQTWQSDMTHWQLDDATDVEIISWLDDHSRFLLHISVHPVVTGPLVTETFLNTAKIHGLPASTLTDNGLIYTTRFANYKGGPNHFEHVIEALGIAQKNGHPGHPQTQGKIERFHQTLKRWLRTHHPDSLEAMQSLLEQFREGYNTRPHRAINRRTPLEAYQALDKAEPHLKLLDRHWRVRHDIVDSGGKVTLRWAGKLRHLNIGRAHAGTRIVLLIAGRNTLVIRPDTAEILAEHTLDESRDYHPKNTKAPPEGGVLVSTMS